MLKRCLLASALVLLPLAAYPQTAVLPNYRCATTAPTTCEGAMWTPSLQAGLTSTKVQIKATAGIFGYLYCYNSNASVGYVQVFNLPSASVTVGSTTPILSLPVAATSIGGFAFGGGAGVALAGSGITVASTTTASGSSSQTMDCNVGYN